MPQNGNMLDPPNTWWLKAVGQLKPGVSFEQAKAAVATIGARIAQGGFHRPRRRRGYGGQRFGRRDTEHRTGRAADRGARRRGDGADSADLLRERQQHAARSRRRAPPRDQRASFARSKPRARRSAIADGSGGARARRRRGGASHRTMGNRSPHARDSCSDAGCRRIARRSRSPSPRRS